MLRWSGMLLWALALNSSASGNDSSSIQVMTFNIRYDNPSDGLDAWNNRKQEVGQFLLGQTPYTDAGKLDIIGFQEALSSQLTFLDTVLNRYTRYSRGRDDGKNAGEHCAIYYRSDRFLCLDSGTFWLSETPHIATKGWDAALPRIASWLKLKEIKNGKVFWVLNTHFDHVGVKAREESAKQLLKWTASLIEPIILMGDLNSEPSEIATTTLRKGGLSESRQMDDLTPSFNGFTWPDEKHKLIDYIFNRGFSSSKYRVNRSKRSNGRVLSDHFPVESVLYW